uniref:Putative basic tail protein n=1 Tax=Ixodes ricinus TaxID=34613 RepID=A0A0K8RD54_IXORI
MGLIGTTLVLVSLAFFGCAAAHNCQNRTRPASEEKREGCDFYCWDTGTNFMGEIFSFRTERNAFTTVAVGERCKAGACHLTTHSGGPTTLMTTLLRPL